MSNDLVAESRNADLTDLARLLSVQKEFKRDAVVPAQAIRSEGAIIHIAGMGDTGPVGDPGVFRPTPQADYHMAEKLNIPVAYLRRMREERTDLYDLNVNGWIHGGEGHDPDGRKFMIRAFAPQEMFGEGVLRAILSDSYMPIDHLDGLTALLAGLQESGIKGEIVSADLTADRMVVKVAAPEVAVWAPKLLDGYRNPFNGGPGGAVRAGNANVRARVSGWTVEGALRAAAAEGQGYAPGQEPVLFAGLKISNHETGGGAWQVVPEAVIKVCANGLTMTVDSMRRAHLGAKLDEGFSWSNETHKRNVELIQSQAKDAVSRFLTEEYWTEVVAGVEEKATKVLEHPAEQVQAIVSQLSFPKETTESLLDFFIKGGQPTAGGLFQAITAYAQTVPSTDLAWDLEGKALQALELAYAS